MSDVERERETLAVVIHNANCDCGAAEETDVLTYDEAASAAVLAALPRLGWVRQPQVSWQDIWDLVTPKTFGPGDLSASAIRTRDFLQSRGVKVVDE